MRIIKNIALALVATGLFGCHTDMWIQAKTKTFEENKVFGKQSSARPLEHGTVARGHARLDDAFYTGFENGKLVKEFPVKVTKAMVERGKEKFEIFCTNCHGAIGNGQGMIAQRGLKLVREPANFHTDRLRTMPVGHFYDVITNGYGVMYPFKDRIKPEDRWNLAAYIRALQLSQNANVADVPADKKTELKNSNTVKNTGSDVQGVVKQ